jgi:hypothetical protein
MSDDSQSTRRRPPDAPCLNCGNTTPGQYCPACGQRKTWVRVSIRTMIADVLEDQLVMNRALPRTLTGLLFRPGWLTQEYVRGRIVSYIAPFRLYIVASVVFFLILSFVGLAALERVQVGTGALSANADSTRAILEERQQTLQGIDTLNMNEAARAGIRQALANAEAARAALDDTTTVIDSARLARLERLAAGDSVIEPGGRQPWSRNFQIQAGTGWLNRALNRKVEQVAHLPPQQAFRAILGDLLEYAPHMVFVLLPVFALLLKLLYIRRQRYYAEHFVFALHVHAFVFIMMTLLVLLPWDWLNVPVILWIMVYVWLALKRVYDQGWLRTTVKWWILGFSYAFVLLFGLIGLAGVALMLT